MLISIFQINPVVGDIEGNCQLILKAAQKAQQAGSKLLIAPELSTIGYPPRDLLFYDNMLRRNSAGLTMLCQQSPIPLLIGTLLGHQSIEPSNHLLCNGAVFIENGSIVFSYRKQLLAYYDIFHEPRYFVPGQSQQRCVLPFENHRLGISICEDIWYNTPYWSKERTSIEPIDKSQQQGADIFINLSASPYEVDKYHKRQVLLENVHQRFGKPIVYVNQVGAQDELVFDGRSMAYNQKGQQILCAKSFDSDLCHINIHDNHDISCLSPQTIDFKPQEEHITEDILDALSLGLKDYMRKTSLKKVVLGLSGGIDSAVTASIAALTLGPQHVHGILMPSRYSSKHSLEDAEALAKNLKITYDIIPIEPIHQSYLQNLQKYWQISESIHPKIIEEEKVCLAEENLQARIRANILMFYSNQHHALLLTTGNKSEIAVGYCTLYGDMSGGLGLIADLYKTEVYQLAHFIQKRHHKVIPQNSIDKAPSAELRPHQEDQDSLPEYPILDGILKQYIEYHQSKKELYAQGFSPDTVDYVINLIEKSEYKRWQMPPGIHLRNCAFGSGRHMPLTGKNN